MGPRTATGFDLVDIGEDMVKLHTPGVFAGASRSHRGFAGDVVAAQRAFASVSGRVAWVLPSYPADLPLMGAEAINDRAALTAFAAASKADVALKLSEQDVLLHAWGGG